MNHQLPRTVGRIVVEWWQELRPGPSGYGGDRAALARLRRVATPTEALLDPSAVALVRRVVAEHPDGRLKEREILALGTLAGVLPHVRSNVSDNRFAHVLGTLNDDERPIFSPLRFAALLAAPDWTARHRHLRRAVHQIGERGFDVARFAQDVFGWGDATRRRWTFEYHQIPVLPASAAGAETEEVVS